MDEKVSNDVFDGQDAHTTHEHRTGETGALGGRIRASLIQNPIDWTITH